MTGKEGCILQSTSRNPLIYETEALGVHHKSKKIRKSKNSPPRQQETENDHHKYNTFENSEKKKIIFALKRALLQSHRHLLKQEISTSKDLLEFLDLIDVNVFSQTLEKILVKNVISEASSLLNV